MGSWDEVCGVLGCARRPMHAASSENALVPASMHLYLRAGAKTSARSGCTLVTAVTVVT